MQRISGRSPTARGRTPKAPPSLGSHTPAPIDCKGGRNPQPLEKPGKAAPHRAILGRDFFPAAAAGTLPVFGPHRIPET